MIVPQYWAEARSQHPGRERWIAEYERKARDYAACRYVGERGSGAFDRVADDVRVLHDELCRAEEALPTA